MRASAAILLSVAACPLFGLAFSPSALAQVAPPSLSPAEIKALPVIAAAASPAVGEQVLGEDGALDAAFFVESRACTVRGCRRFIFDKRSGALILNDRVWSEAYAPTGRGAEVIRVKAFAAAEQPKPAPDDKALESAPAIRSVARPQEKKSP